MSLSNYDRWKLASPPDYSRAYEEAAEEFDTGYLEGEFEEALEEVDLLGEIHSKMREEHGANYWPHYVSFVEEHFPKTFERIMEKVVEERGERIIEEDAHGETR